MWELAKPLQEKGVQVEFAIHPVAGRMPGHMNVLLAGAGVPYDMIYDIDGINADFPNADAALVIGANDVVNPAARDDRGSPIYAMPILDVDKAQSVLIVKRGKGASFPGIESRLFYGDNARKVYGDAQDVVSKLIAGVKKARGDGRGNSGRRTAGLPPAVLRRFTLSETSPIASVWSSVSGDPWFSRPA